MESRSVTGDGGTAIDSLRSPGSFREASGGSDVGKDNFVLAGMASLRRRFAAVHQHRVRPHLMRRGGHRVLHGAGIVGFDLHLVLRPLSRPLHVESIGGNADFL